MGAGEIKIPAFRLEHIRRGSQSDIVFRSDQNMPSFKNKGNMTTKKMIRCELISLIPLLLRHIYRELNCLSSDVPLIFSFR